MLSRRRLEHGPDSAPFGYDDEGVPAQWHAIITDGLFTGYRESRKPRVHRPQRSGARCARNPGSLADHSHDEISILPGTWRYEDLIADTDDAILMETNRSWSSTISAIISVFHGNCLGDQGRQENADAETSQLQRHHHRILE